MRLRLPPHLYSATALPNTDTTADIDAVHVSFIDVNGS